jgi:hypothetical protein
MILQEMSWVGRHGTYPEMGIIPEGKVVIPVIENERTEEVMIHKSHIKDQQAE